MRSLATERALAALLLLVVGLALLVSTTDLEFAELGSAFKPTFFPQIVLVLWVGLAVIGLAAEIARPEPSGPLDVLRVLALAVGLVAYALCLMPAGFFLTSALFCAVALWLLQIRALGLIAAFSIGLPGVLVLLFNHLLTLPLPTSPFTYLL